MKKFKALGQNIKAIGIDVSSKNLSVCIILKSRELLCQTIKNTQDHILTFIKNIKGFKGQIAMESTGRYHLLAAVLLHENKMNVCIVNPLVFKKYSQANIRKVKTDKVDSKVIAQIADKETLKSFVATRKDIDLSKKVALISKLENEIQVLRATLNDYEQLKESLSLDISDSEKNIVKAVRNLEVQKLKLQKEVEDSVGSNDKNVDNLTSVPGISKYLASLISHAFKTDFGDSAKKWVAFIGMDVSVAQSGNWKRKGKLSKRGNGYFRKRFFGAAWGATMHDVKFKQYYDYLKNQRGRNHIEALNIIARKLIRIAFAIVCHDQVFDPEKCYFPCD